MNDTDCDINAHTGPITTPYADDDEPPIKRPDRRLLVMRRAPMIGRPASALRVSVYHRVWSLQWAIKAARAAIETDTRRGNRAWYWIVEAGRPAHRKAE